MNAKIFNPLLNETFLIRPNTNIFTGKTVVRPGDYKHPNQILRYSDGQWLPDDGKPDLAFVNGVFYYGVNIPRYTNLLWEWNDKKLTQSFLPEYLWKHASHWHYYTINNTPLDDLYKWDNEKHPNEIATKSASDKSCKLYSCANGAVIDIDRENEDKFTSGGIIIKSTMQPLTKPENPTCYLCLNNGRGHLLKALKDYKENLEYDIEDYDNQISKAQSDIYDWERNKEKALESLSEANEELKKLEV